MKSGWRRAASMVCCAFASSATALGGVLFVDADAPPLGTGLSWGSAFQRLESALQTASLSGGLFDEVWVAEGTYRPDGGSNDRNATFQLFSGVAVRGGFVGTESAASERVPGASTAVLSGDIGVQGDALDNCFHVVSMRVLFAPATIDGFTIRGGRADAGTFPNNSGGGVLSEGSLTIVDCVVEENHAASGAGVFSRFGAGTVIGCVFRSNFASSEGGGVYIRDAGELSGCAFNGNNASFGGGLWSCCGVVNVSDCTFASNFGNFGGAVFNSSSSLRMKRSSFVGNSASRGGAVHSGTNTWIVNCFFGGNSGDRGGALYSSSWGNVANSVFSRNFAVSSGGAVWAASSVNASSCAFHGNTALLFGGGLYCEAGTTNITNAILWSNTDNTGSGQAAQATRAGGTLNVNRSCLQGWTGSLGGVGNIGVPPLFVNPAGADGVPGTLDDDFSLSAISPCIDVGDAALLLADATDLDGDADTAEETPLDYMLSSRRIEYVFGPPNGPASSPLLDMGAVEFVPPPRVVGDANGDQVVDFADITAVLANWGLVLVAADVDDSGEVDFADVTLVLSNWGNSV
jgi:hypothetical protein